MSRQRDESNIEVTGMVIGASPIGEYDRRVVLLTRERGKLSAFARGAGRPRSPLVAAACVFSFGTFQLREGSRSRTLSEAQIRNYFPYFRTHLDASLTGQYFCEVLDYCTRENNDEAQLLLLMYQSLRAMESERFPLQLVRSIFELKTVVIEGELQEPPSGRYHPAVMAALRHITESSVGSLYTFLLEEEAQEQLSRLATLEMNAAFEHHRFRSLEILESMQL